MSYILILKVIWLVDQVKQQRQKGDTSPYVTELLRLEEIARDQGLGCWSKVDIHLRGFQNSKLCVLLAEICWL